MRTEGSRELRRPRGVVLRPLGLLLAAIATGLGMWHVLMRDGGRLDRRLGRHDRFSIERFVRGLTR